MKRNHKRREFQLFEVVVHTLGCSRVHEYGFRLVKEQVQFFAKWIHEFSERRDVNMTS